MSENKCHSKAITSLVNWETEWLKGTKQEMRYLVSKCFLKMIASLTYIVSCDVKYPKLEFLLLTFWIEIPNFFYIMKYFLHNEYMKLTFLTMIIIFYKCCLKYSYLSEDPIIHMWWSFYTNIFAKKLHHVW